MRRPGKFPDLSDPPPALARVVCVNQSTTRGAWSLGHVPHTPGEYLAAALADVRRMATEARDHGAPDPVRDAGVRYARQIAGAFGASADAVELSALGCTPDGSPIVAWASWGDVRGMGRLSPTRAVVDADVREDRHACEARRGYSDRVLVAVDLDAGCWSVWHHNASMRPVLRPSGRIVRHGDPMAVAACGALLGLGVPMNV